MIFVGFPKIFPYVPMISQDFPTSLRPGYAKPLRRQIAEDPQDLSGLDLRRISSGT
jgi:hypothetical protein